jgi:endo-1,3-1,4-beta-glycanase ExoK
MDRTSWVVLALLAGLTACGSPDDLILGTDEFRLERRDEFEALDLSYWELASHTFEPNLAWFTPNNAKVEGGRLVLSITADAAPAAPGPDDQPKPYSAAEVRTRVPFLYGRFRARARLAPGAGIISAFWGFYDRYSNDTGAQIDNQIVIEAAIPRGETEHELRYTVQVPTEAPTPEVGAVGFDLTSDFHVIGYDWTPTEVRFSLDDVVQSVVSGDAAAQLTQYQRLVLSSYPSDAGWLSSFDPAALPVVAEFDWVEIYRYEGF